MRNIFLILLTTFLFNPVMAEGDNRVKTDVTILVADSEYNFMNPSWSPDGQKIAFSILSLI